MLLSDTIKTAFRGITVNKNRTFLTMLGIIIGVASVVLMVSLGRSFQNYITELVESFGTNMVEVMPKGFEKFGGNLESLTFDDYQAVKKLSTVQDVTPMIIVAKPVRYGKDDLSPMILGSHEEVFGIYGFKLDRGRLIDQSDDEGAKSVAVIGSKTAEDFFGNADPLGKKVYIGDSTFTVIGVLKSVGSLITQDMDSMVVIPFTTARALTGQKYLSVIVLRAAQEPSLAVQDITLLLRQRHRIDNPGNDPDKDDFIAQSAEQITQTVNTVTFGLTVFLALIAGISLLVGGIGIMNIMLVSVTERTREIGLRKAVGARSRDILLQFLFEAVSLTFTGGMIGLALGIFFGWLLSAVAARILGNFSFVLSTSAIVLALSMALGTGLVFGIYPAKRAANLSPMEALRYE
jgi:putative ABC transport system permease protein